MIVGTASTGDTATGSTGYGFEIPQGSPAELEAAARQVATLRAGQPRPRVATVITTAETGSFRLERDSSSGEASLTPLPSADYLLELRWFGGFDVAAT